MGANQEVPQTVIILTGGCILFGDAMPLNKFLGIVTAMFGIVWYSWLKMRESSASRAKSALPVVNGSALHDLSINEYEVGRMAC